MKPTTRLLLALSLAGALATGSAYVASAKDPSNPSEPSAGAGVNRVTLITGDRVSLTAEGTLGVEFADPLRRKEYQELTQNGDHYVIPTDAERLIQSGVLDQELFNITGLVRQGYDDQHSATIPLLTKGADTGIAAQRELPGAGIAVVEVAKSAAATAWRGLANRDARLAGQAKVWLDRKVSASIDQSVPRIGGPAAWERGLTGRGVTVAVLDTGIDSDHPDFAGRVTRSRDFTGASGVEDGNGHGTHVASTAAGTGAASGGRYRGVAPDASLAIGKVLDDNGIGTMSSVLAGMEWAATEAGATVVNLSLGGAVTDGTDPLSAAVNTLTATHGTLFVAAAGNQGKAGGVATPAAADAALAVGSVDKSDKPSPFSNLGPRRGDGAAKPDLVAPGQGIVAAMPAGVPPIGEPVGEAYQRLDGTSMATPHVTGAVALLAQQHPDWPADRLKAAMMSTATEVAGAGPYTVGTGRVDVDRATGQAVTATGSVSTFLAWPNDGRSETRAVTWHNSGATPVTLSLAADLRDRAGNAAPAGMVALAADSVTVDAGGSARVDLTIAAKAGAAGNYVGTLTATGPGGVRTRTTLAVEQEQEMYDVTVNLVNRDGAPATAGDAHGHVFSLDRVLDAPFSVGNAARVPAGRYSVTGRIDTPVAGHEPSVSVITHPELMVDHDVELTLDARVGQPMSIVPDNPAARGGTYVANTMTRVADCSCVRGFTNELDPVVETLFVGTVPGTSSDSYAFALSRQAIEPRAELHVDGPDPFEVAVDWWDASPVPTERRSMAAVYAGRATPDELAKLDVRGKLVMFDVPRDGTYGDVRQATVNIKNAGAPLAMVMLEGTGSGPGLAANGTGDDPTTAVPTLWGHTVTTQRFRTLLTAGEVPVRYAGKANAELRYELWFGITKQVTAPQTQRPRTRDLAAVPVTYYDNTSGGFRFLGASAPFFGTTVAVQRNWAITTPQHRTEYFTPGDWRLSVIGADALEATRTLRGGINEPLEWDKAVIGPSLRGTTSDKDFPGGRPWAWRSGDAIDVVLPMHSDSSGHVRVPESESTGSISLYRDGALVATVESPTTARVDVPADAGSYRLSATATRSSPQWPLATTVAADWTFRSSATDEGKPLPLLTVRFDPKLDLHNRAPGNRSFAFMSFVERQDRTPKVVKYAVEVSYDDGATWKPAKVTRSGQGWRVTVNHPKAGYASLRATAADTDGNTVVQTVLRAYQVGDQ